MNVKDIEREVETAMNHGLSCSEAMLQVFNSEYRLGLDKNALKMATGFTGGVGDRQNICGALTGAVMVIGAMKGRVSPDENREAAMALTVEVFDRFQEHFGDVRCAEILRDKDLSCPGKVVPECARILAEAIQENA